MFILPGIWELASLLAKILLYVGAFSIAGGSLSAWRYSNADRALLFSNFSYIFVGTVIGFHGALLVFLVQVGLINDSGLPGMFDWMMISILLDTGLGDVTLLRLLAFILAGITSVIVIKKLQSSKIDLKNPLIRLLFLLQLIALMVLAFSHRMTGHMSVLSLVAQISIVMHFAAFALWIGCLYPFLQLSRSVDIDVLEKTLKRFGNNAIVIVFALLLGGGLMLYELFESPMALVTSDYGLALLLKLTLVLVILGVATMNKLMLVPMLISSGSRVKLQRSIRYELAIAVAILVVTSYLSTIVGPAEHQM
jgi:putative copper resistance protein D